MAQRPDQGNCSSWWLGDGAGMDHPPESQPADGDRRGTLSRPGATSGRDGLGAGREPGPSRAHTLNQGDPASTG